MLVQIADGVWGMNGTASLALGCVLPARATLMRVGDGLVLHSPLAIDDGTAAEIAELGEVRVILAPNTMHWLHVEAAAKRYPRARIHGVPGLEKKLALSLDEIPEDGALGEELRIIAIRGAPKTNEHVFLHVPSRSLVVADLMFNVHAGSLPTSLLLRMVGAWRKPAQSRAWRFLVEDRAAAAASAAAIFRWDFDRVVVAHGDVVTEDAHAVTENALAFLLGGASAASREQAPAHE